MAKKKNLSYNDIPNMQEDWSLDPRNGFKYSGESVQRFIKENLNSKMGYFYYDTASNRYLVFSSEETKNQYVDNPSLTDLVLGSFDAPFNYEASITLLTPTYNAVFFGSTGNYLDFTFDIKNKSGNSTGENVNVTYTFIRNATKKVVTESRRYGETVHLNIDEYLLEGANTVIIGVQGQTSLAATTASVTYQVVNLSYSDEINIANVYDLTDGSKTIEVFFNVSGYGTKIVEWFLDGQQLPFVKTEDEVVDVASSRIKYIELSNLSSGIHTVQSRAYTLINGEKFYTDTLYREIMVTNGSSNENMIAMTASLPNSHGIVTEQNPLVIYGAEQYIPFELRFATRKSGELSVLLGGEPLTTLLMSSGKESTYQIVSNKSGTLQLSFSGSGIERVVSVSVNKTTLNLEEIDTSLVFDFSARGKSNSSVNKDSWSYGNYKGTFSGFNWNASSGWVDNALLINSGASFSVDIAPLENDATSLGKTLEFEFYTKNVEDDNAVVCDLTTNGVGLLITASEARMTSAAGESVSTKFKAGEVNRIAFVINRKSSVTYKGLVFIYVNGIISGAVNYGSADNFISNKQLAFTGSEDAQVAIRSIKFYDIALSSDNILNNYTLYRDTLNEMMEVYYRNDIYEQGTSSFSTDALLHRLPVMVITGDIPTLEAATSTSTQILVDIDYKNEQDPSKNFTMKNAALRIQGTSSLAYPRKNFRFYTKKEESTLVYDADGNIIKDKLYSFVDNAQPVDCWCLKADFAESSGTHNTGIARIWNKVMYGAIIQHTNILGQSVNGYALRTSAQVAALEEGFKYDVRTTIDGFPIVLFYKKNASDTDLIFLGKYNFNNDKSTPSVFGFENIPNFDNGNMQCWETKDNGHPLGLFTDVSNFDRDWSEAFESRYPDTKTPNTSDLKSFSQWLSNVSQEDFATQKWEHLDVYKVAAYYVYLMRFGAVDQPVKNGFLTSEDGVKFYYINYDNDTINGLINTGELRLAPTINRQTIGSDGEYVYAGHESRMWNRLEADAEFMDIVSIVDNALYSAGLRYDEVMKVFNDEQSDKWAERVYNQDAEYKYLLPYVNQATNNLFMLQGSRSSHRAWWLSKRFSLYDSLFISGAYRDRNISFKCLNDTQAGQKFTIKAGTEMNYGYGVNNGIRETGVALGVGEAHTFTTTDTLNLGDVVKVFAASDLMELDLSAMADRLAVLDCSAASDNVLGSKMKKLTLGCKGLTNTELKSISGINKLESLQEVNVEGYQNITTLDFTTQKDLRKVYAKGSGVASIDFSAGAPVDYLELPSAMLALNFKQLPYLSLNNVVLEGGLANISSISITGCPNMTNDFSFVKGWADQKNAEDSSCTLVMDGVDWTASYEDFLAFSQHKANGMKMDLRGKIYLSSLDLEQANVLQEIWGSDCFDKNADFRITAPDALYINPDNVTLNEGESVQFSYILFANTEGSVTYKIVSGSRVGTTLDENTGLLTTTENGNANAELYIRAIYTSNKGNTTYATATVNIKKRIYPTSASVTLNGATTIGNDEVYSWTTTASDVNGNMEAEWVLSGNAVEGGYISLGENSLNQCVIKFHNGAEPNETITATLTLTLKKKVDGSTVAGKSLNIKVAQVNYPSESNTTIEGESSPSADNEVYTWSSSVSGMIGKFTATWTLDDELLPYYEIKSQEWDAKNPLQGSCTLQKIMDVEYFMKGNINLVITKSNGDSIVISKSLSVLSPDVIMTIDTNPAVMEVMYNNGLAAHQTYMTKQEAEAVKDGTFNPSGSQSGSIFYNNTSITSFDEFRYFTGMTTLDAYAFYNCTRLKRLKVPTTVVNFGTYCCYRSASYSALNIDSLDVETVASYAFYAANDAEGVSGSIKINNVNWYCTETCSTSRQDLFYRARIISLKVFNLSSGYASTSVNYQHFGNAYLMNIDIDESISIIPSRAFYQSYIYELHLHNNVTEIQSYAFNSKSRYNVLGFNGSSIKNLESSCFVYPTFTEDMDFRNITFTTSIYDSSGDIESAIYEKSLDLSSNIDGGNTLEYRQFIKRLSQCEILILPSKVMAYVCKNIDEMGKVNNLYIPNIANYCNSSFNQIDGGNITTISSNVYTKDLNTNEYVQITDFKPSDWIITSIPSYAFYRCKAITGYDATGVKDHNAYVFYNSGIKTLKLDNQDGQGTIANYAFAGCASLETITDTSYSPWATLNNLAFSNVNANVKINSQVFGLYKQSSGFTLSPMDNGVVSALAFGEYTFTCPNGAAFGDGTTSKTLTLGYTGAIEDLTERLKIEYLTLVISSNIDTAQFKLTYTASDGTAKEDVVLAGFHLLKVTKGTNVTITPEGVIKGWTAPASATVTMSSTSNSKAMDYTEEALVYIADTSGNLYTEAEWTASGKTNDQAEGVCVMRSFSGGFIIAKDDASSSSLKWGGYKKTVSNIVTSSSKAIASLDIAGYDNTSKIIEQCTGYTNNNITGAPAAEACASYTFPSGVTGYLPALGEWNMAYDNKKAVVSAMSLIGGTAIQEQDYWSSTQYDGSYSWLCKWSNGTLSSYYKSYAYYVRAFTPYGYLNITANLFTNFTLEYTNNYNERVTKKVGVGGVSLNIKVGTIIHVIPDLPYAEPQTFTWTGLRKDLNFVFSKDAGVYIQHVDGSLYTETEWTAGGYANSDANGVAVLSSDASFVIAKENVGSFKWGEINKTIKNIETSTTVSIAVLDMNGITNTTEIINQDDAGLAAAACFSFTFPNGRKGYLPSLGEWDIAKNNSNNINSALTLIGGNTLTGYYWSSTQYDWNSAWRGASASAINPSSTSKAQTHPVRPFTTV